MAAGPGDDGAAAVVRALLDAGAVADGKDNSGRTPVDLVRQFAGGQAEAVAMLSGGADIGES